MTETDEPRQFCMNLNLNLRDSGKVDSTWPSDCVNFLVLRISVVCDRLLLMLNANKCAPRPLVDLGGVPRKVGCGLISPQLWPRRAMYGLSEAPP